MLRATLRKRLRFAHGEGVLEADLRVGPGEMAALSGPSGSGKTSLLRMVAGLLRPDEGRIEVGGETWFDSKAKVDWPPQRRRAGLVFQDYALFPHMSVRGNLEYALPRGSDRSRVDGLLSAMGLSGLGQSRPGALSGGQKQRVALARALASAPRLLLLDEPLAAVDGPMRARLQEDLAAQHRASGLPAFLASHDPAEIVRLAARVYRLDAGSLVDAGAPADAFGGGLRGGPGERPGNGNRLRGTVLSVEPSGAMSQVFVLAGGQVAKVAVPAALGDTLKPGDAVNLALSGLEPAGPRA